MRGKSKYISLTLISVLLVAVLFVPIQVANAATTELKVENVSIEWIANQTDYKEALFHVTTNKGSYDFLLKGNISQVESETIILVDLYVLQEETYILGQSINTSIPDTLYDAPYVTPGTSVEAVHIHLGPVLAAILYIAAAAAILIIIFISFLMPFIESIISGALLYALNVLIDGIFYASIPWTFITIYDSDKNPDESMDFYIPYDTTQQSLVDEDHFYLATPFTWWHIEEQWFFIIHYYSATWVQSRITPGSPPMLSPHASFSWTPDIIGPGQTVTFYSSSFDPDGEIQSWHWWFGDGSEAYGETVTHIYSHTGYYNVRLEVTDNDGLTDETSTAIMGIMFNVVPEAPLGTIGLILAMIGALGLFVIYPRRRTNRRARIS